MKNYNAKLYSVDQDLDKCFISSLDICLLDFVVHSVLALDISTKAVDISVGKRVVRR